MPSIVTKETSTEHMNMADPTWWRQASVYQIYPRSFSDSNGDGIGDINGITAKVPYLKDLGIDAVWLSPFYPSALADGGYDVDDYRNVDPRLGTLEDFNDMDPPHSRSDESTRRIPEPSKPSASTAAEA